VAASGSGLGLLLGGALTSYLSWRWCLYVNLLFAGFAITGGALLLGRQPGTPGARLDLPGVAAVSGGIFSLVYGFANAATHGWHTPSTWGFLAAGTALLIVFAVWQTRAAHPLLPPRVALDRNRGGAYLTMLVQGAAVFGIFLFLVYYMQLSLGYSAVNSGVALLPMVAVIGIIANVGNIKLMPRVGPKPLISLGLLAGAIGMAWLTRIGVHSGYVSHLLGPTVMVGLGMGLIFSAVANTGTFGVEPRDARIASASAQTGQQLGGSIGTALLNTVAASAATGYLVGHLHGRPAPQLLELAAIHSYTTVFWWCAAIFAVGAVISGTLLRRGPLARPEIAPAPELPRELVAARS
jgi:MFS family permease